MVKKKAKSEKYLQQIRNFKMANEVLAPLGEQLNELKRKFHELESYMKNECEIQMNEYQIQMHEHFYSLKNEIDIKREVVLQNFYEKNEIDADFIDRVQRSSADLIKVNQRVYFLNSL